MFSLISNPFIFLKEYENLIRSNELIYNKIEKDVKLIFKDKFSNVELYSTKNGVRKIQYEHLMYTLLKIYSSEIRNMINKNAKFIPKYKVELMPYNPKEYVLINAEKIESYGDLELDDKYLFKVEENSTKTHRYPLDSKPELRVFNILKQQSDRLFDKIKVWSKNMVHSNVSSEYLDYNNNLRRSFFDYVIKFNNGAYLYIEVKSTKDINAEHTKLLKKIL